MQTQTNKPKLVFSNCFLQALKLKAQHPTKAKFSWDFNSPSGSISFFVEMEGKRYRFRRKLRRYSNKGKYFFYGYRYIEDIKTNEHGSKVIQGRC